MPRSLLALKDRYGKSKLEEPSSDDQEEQEIDVEGDDGCETEQREDRVLKSDDAGMAIQEECQRPNSDAGASKHLQRKTLSLSGIQMKGVDNEFESKVETHSVSTQEAVNFKTGVAEIELGIWPKPVHCSRKNSDAGMKYLDIEEKPYRPWECGYERYELHPIRPKASLPRNGFIAEFGHLGFRDHWKRTVHAKNARAEGDRIWRHSFGRSMGAMSAMDSLENWELNGSVYSGYFAPYRRAMVPLPRDCYSCIPFDRHACLEDAKKRAMGAFERQMAVAAEKFSHKFQEEEQQEAPVNSRKRPFHETKAVTEKQGMGVPWQETASERARNMQLKKQRMASVSPTFDCVPAEKAKEEQERPYHCTICEKTFKRRSSLATHKFIHTDLKPHVCSVCNKRFLRKSDLKKHGLMHSGKKPYQCEKCGRRFSQSSNMLTHLRRHMGIRPFECSICGRSFFRKVDLKRHEGRHMAKKLKTKCSGE